MNSSSGSQGNAVYLCYTNLIRTYVLDILCVIELFDFAQDFITYNDYLEASFVQALKTAERAARKKQLEQEKAKQDEDRKKRAASMVSTPTTTKGYTSKHADSPVAVKKINEIVRENITGESSSRPAQTQVEAQDSSKNSSVSSGHKLAASYLVKLVKNNMGTINIVILIVLVINYIRKKYPMGRLLPLFVEKLKIATTMATKITYM
ncbi:hypothetical protein AX774_g2515 [Zancudomyces culisetae]|uniref:Uncharacterized protein n=1 Tax=Zancudomyces culisetae TaxID=1213189 RepID=A0A1R1PSN0_ZANCU|nr:hypothetical protein AX774_g2515 [Zancudomyces culisetae]|eukprot:OMH83968.1 hypothetical protein AX774_g2515 [Zancudomyces culisetae]